MIVPTQAIPPARHCSIVECAIIDGLLRMAYEQHPGTGALAASIAAVWPDRDDGDDTGDECPA